MTGRGISLDSEIGQAVPLARRFQVLAQCASWDSWQMALAYHKEMNSHGMELPPSELIEFVEVTTIPFPDVLWHHCWSCRCLSRAAALREFQDLLYFCIDAFVLGS